MAFEQNKSNGYMEVLDRWTEEHVITPLLEAWSGQEDNDPQSQEAVKLTCEQIKRAIREKTLDSYHNGQKAGPGKTLRK